MLYFLAACFFVKFLIVLEIYFLYIYEGKIYLSKKA